VVGVVLLGTVVVLRGAVLVVDVVVRLVEGVVVLVVVGFVVFGLVGSPNDPPPAVPPVVSCWEKAEATESERIAINPIKRSIEKGIAFLLLNKDELILFYV